MEVSRFGMSCMRLPHKKDRDGNSVMDVDKSIEIIKYALENGVNYFDTAYVYGKDGKSEETLGKALKGNIRDKVFVATKSPVPLNKEYENFNKYLDEQLKRLQMDYVDFYLFHGLDQNSWGKVKSFKLLDEMEKARKKGKIRYIAFSFHGNLKLFKNIIDSYSWDMYTIQLNFMGENCQAGVAGLKYASSKGIGVIIMEPLLGGILGENAPDDIIKEWDSSGIKRTPAEWAFRWLAGFPEVTVIRAGFTA